MKIDEALKIVQAEMGITIRRRKLSDLKADPKNMRKHTARNKGMIIDALQELGAGRSVVTDANDVTRAGNATVEAAQAVGITDGIEIESTGKALVIHKRGDLTDETKAKRLAFVDNAAADQAEWDADHIREEIGKNRLLLDGLVTAAELAKMMATPEVKVAETDNAEVPISDELLESHNFVVLYFDNELDWQVATQAFGLKTVKGVRSKGNFQQRGVGRVIKGAAIVAKLAAAK